MATITHVLFVRFKSFLMLLGVGGLVVVAFVGNLIWTGVDTYAAGLPYWSQVAWWLRQAMNLAINIAALTLLFRFVPKTSVAWSDALAGAVVAGIGWEIGRQVLSAFVIGQHYGNAYGVIGSFLAVMLWCFYGVAVLLLGAEYTQALGADRQGATRQG